MALLLKQKTREKERCDPDSSSRKSSERDKQITLKREIDRWVEQAKTSLYSFENKPADTKQEAKKDIGKIEPGSLVVQQKKFVDSQHILSKQYMPIDEVIGIAAANIARDINASCVISIESKEKPQKDAKDYKDYLFVQVSIFKKNNNCFERVEYTTKMRKVISGSIIPVKELLMEAINRKYINKGDRIVCVEDESLGMGYKGLLFVFDVDQIFFNISHFNLASNVSPEVIESVINIALEISKEGREGKSVGTGFVIGNKEEVIKYTQQMIINPFANYPEELRNIADPNIKETVKNFAMLDGVFVIDEKGTLITAGAHLNLDVSAIKMPGYGTRHRCCAAITKQCNAISVVVSESGGVTSVFKNGKLVMKL